MKRIRHCYLCRAPKPDSVDHIPPDGFFPAPKPPNLYTVPCCTKCNKGFSDEDEAFRQFLSGVEGASEEGNQIFSGPVMRKLNKSPKLQRAMLESAEKTWRLTQRGILIPALRMEYDGDKVCRFMIRITKGLLATFYPDYDYFNDKFTVILSPLARTEDERIKLYIVSQQMKLETKGEGVFRFKHRVTSKSGQWLIQFYGAQYFMVIHLKPELAEREVPEMSLPEMVSRLKFPDSSTPQ